ncbi:hypothetical protein HPB50_020870 [Hyalomma asiaticum]|uniref:Uncharacterized protein n=1 Tax=Hyalomma asiaticum TaxID=266040 RepID=A0ACB7RUR6_HYAAI|nr:hypothetical protein HPB50_020870 [Hyalomma asiaticum]
MWVQADETAGRSKFFPSCRLFTLTTTTHDDVSDDEAARKTFDRFPMKSCARRRRGVVRRFEAQRRRLELGMPDMTALSRIDEDTINNNLRTRYRKDKIYVSFFPYIRGHITYPFFSFAFYGRKGNSAGAVVTSE